MSDWSSILPHLFLAGGGFAVLSLGAFRKRAGSLLFPLALGAVLLAALSAVLVDPPAERFLGLLEVAGYARFFGFLFTLIAALTLLFSARYGALRGFGGDEYYSFILFAALGMMLVAGAVHWLIFLLGMEILSLSFYVLIAIRKDHPASNEAAVKYFIMGAVASAFLTFGIAVAYAATGSLDLTKTLSGSVPAEDRPLILLALSLILAGIGFKISMVPIHLWTPDVYQGAPAPVTAFLSTGAKIAFFAAFLRFISHSGGEVWEDFAPVLWILAALTMIVGNLSAFGQTQVKRLLAYSSIAQMGYLLMALLAVKGNGAAAIMFYLAVYALMDLGAFGTLGGLSPENQDLDDLTDFQGLAYAHPWRAAVLTICLLSLAGLPPTGGFIGKFSLFWAVLEAGFVTLAVIGILTVIFSIYYYFKVIAALFHRPAVFPARQPASLPDRLGSAVVVILLLILGLVPGFLFSLIGRALAVF